jgi:hypothetical protein
MLSKCSGVQHCLHIRWRSCRLTETTRIPSSVFSKSSVTQSLVWHLWNIQTWPIPRGYLLIGHSNITNHGYKYYQLTLTQKITSNELRVRSAWYTTPPPRPKKLIKNVESDLAPHVYSDQYTQSNIYTALPTLT